MTNVTETFFSLITCERRSGRAAAPPALSFAASPQLAEVAVPQQAPGIVGVSRAQVRPTPSSCSLPSLPKAELLLLSLRAVFLFTAPPAACSCSKTLVTNT